MHVHVGVQLCLPARRDDGRLHSDGRAGADHLRLRPEVHDRGTHTRLRQRLKREIARADKLKMLMPSRINKAVELLSQGQPIYYTGAEDRTYEGGRAAAKTWADYIAYEMEHGPFDVTALLEFMRGLIDGGPTASGHRTPAVIVTLPVTGASEDYFRANEWMVSQVLAAGRRGILLCHAESPAAVEAFVQSTRYTFRKGTRGSGGQGHAASVWGVSVPEYLDKADPWPL